MITRLKAMAVFVVLLLIMGQGGTEKTATSAVALKGENAIRSIRVELPGQEHNRLKMSMPGIGCWFWVGRDFEPNGYKSFIDLYVAHTNFRLISTSIRHNRWVDDSTVHDQVKKAAIYAREHDMGIVFDLDIRLARESFRKKYPDDQQELVRMRQIDLEKEGCVSLTVEGMALGDHYTFGPATGYECYASRLLRVYSYVEDKGYDQGLLRDVRDITNRCQVEQADGEALRVSIPCSAEDAARKACVLAAFTLFTPDVFSPHLPEFERELLRQYADVPLAGACKDEWGFPGRFKPSPSDLWYSEAMAKAYAMRRPGHDLARDILLMFKGEEGRQSDRTAAINHYMQMAWQQCAKVEGCYYDAIKEVFGDQAMVMTHATWVPFPSESEVFKNGLDWWAVKRDLAQTDESTPYCVRTALAKKWNSPLWYNMYYAPSRAAYETELWRSVLGGGRINYHQLFSFPNWLTNPDWNKGLLNGALMRAECRVQLLNYISTKPIDCPVAVIFGHAAVTNWAGSGFEDVGMRVADKLWEYGYYADLIPTSEIEGGALRVSEDGRIQYGPQCYIAAVLYNPEYEGQATVDFFKQAAGGGKTRLFQVGAWSNDFEGNPFGGAASLPKSMMPQGRDNVAIALIEFLKTKGVEPYTPCAPNKAHYGSTMVPATTGRLRLLDGTVIYAAGTNEVAGDSIQKTFTVRGGEVTFDAVGVAAVRLDGQGGLEAMAAGGLKSFLGGGVSIELPDRIDVALWKDNSGAWQGVLQGHQGSMPETLASLCQKWTCLRVPEPLRE